MERSAITLGYDEIMFAFFLAILASCTFALAWAMLFCKGYVLSAVLSLFTVVLVFLSAKGWLAALVNSGKGTEVLGFGRYPAAPIAYTGLLPGSLVCFFLSLWLLKRKRAPEDGPTME